MPSRWRELPATAPLRLPSGTVTRKPMRSKELSKVSRVGTELGTARNYPQLQKAANRPLSNFHVFDYKIDMAESEGFEPPIALRLCLISSQVHSTGLCQLS